MTKDKNSLTTAMRAALENAHQFLTDSMTLEEKGSLGHATSLAILGFEEAHKAYLLVLLLPCFEGIIPSSFKKKVETQIRDHRFKLRMAIGFQAFMTYVMYLEMDDQERTVFKEKAANYREKSEKYETDLNKVKNDGFYVEPFRKGGMWSPASATERELHRALEALEVHIDWAGFVIDFYSARDIEIPDEMAMDAKKLGQALQKHRVRGPSSFKLQLKKGGELGEFMRGFVSFLEEVYDVKLGPRIRK
ncbi:MAG: AbiV family abortive infection protein [Thermoplasmata archaeon]